MIIITKENNTKIKATNEALGNIIAFIPYLNCRNSLNSLYYAAACIIPCTQKVKTRNVKPKPDKRFKEAEEIERIPLKFGKLTD